MKITDRFNNYIEDREYKIIIKENYLNIVNYDEIVDFSLYKVSVRIKNKLILVEGTRLVISKMLEQEVLITGDISNLRIN